jgi:bifunctional non-homologous end joining protein LigD
MLATLVDAPFDDDDWAFELKWDGYRALALVTPDGTELRSRTGRDLSASFDLDLRRAVLAQEAVLDGEVVVLDKDGRASFQALQGSRGPVTFVAFDLLYEDGAWLLERPWRERTARLDAVLSPDAAPRAIRSDHVLGRGRALFEAAEAAGVEGIVAKRVESAYHPARRGDDWRKIKVRQRVTAVIGGYTAGAGARRGSFGALVVGAYGPDGLHYLGHVGSGFRDDELRRLRARLDALADPTCPFVTPPPEARGVRWVRPELTCTVLYTEQTADGRLRAPVYAGLSDVPPSEARLSPTPESPTPPVDPGLKEQRIADGGREIRLTNLGKPFWPEEGITKGDLLRYYAEVAPALLPHLAGRPMVLKRYPNGWNKPFFFQHNLPADAPEWLPRIELVRGDKPSREPNRYGMVDDSLSLLWVVNLGCIDLNPWQSRAETPDEPTHVLFDLDPAEGLPFDAVVEVALLVREDLEALGLGGVPKTSGSDGMHVFLPVGPGLTYEVTKLFAQAVAERLVRRRPDLVTTQGLIAKRGARVYLDANQNGRGRTVASVYSVRPRPGAPVSTPLLWSEVRPGLDPRAFGTAAVLERVATQGDLFADALYEPQDLASAVARLSGGE